MNLIILAPPGAGKGTQAEMLSKHFNIPTISTGAMLRHNIDEGTELGEIAKKFIDDGKFVPDDVMINMVKARLSQPDCKNGFILDGFPRNIKQAETLTASKLKVDAVLTLEVSDDEIIRRVSGRLECSECGTAFHKEYRKPAKEGICDNCGGTIKTRKDDKPETVKERLNTYHTLTEPLKAYFEERGLLKTVIGREGIDDTSREVLRVLGE